MPPPLSLRGLLVIFAVSLGALLIVEHWVVEMRLRPDATAMHRAAALAAERMTAVRTLKERRGLWAPAPYPEMREWMLGAPYSPITTTLGSREAKLTSTNPAFAALLVRWLHEAGVDTGDAVGVTLSGSFPALGIAALTAVEVVGARAVLVSSLGASSFGANQPEATWLDMEHWLVETAGLPAGSTVVTPGAEWDAGGGLPEGGLDVMHAAARRCGVMLKIPGSLEEGIRLRTDLFFSQGISALVNIGGGQTSLGTCPHASTLPTGYWPSLPACSHAGRGVVERVAERGIPVIHLLNIRELAHRYGIPVGEGRSREDPVAVYSERAVPTLHLAGIVGILVIIVHLRKFKPRLMTSHSHQGGDEQP